jgi:hypothetical protein
MQSAKGNWYLANPRRKTTATGNIITLPYAHDCEGASKRTDVRATEEKTELRNIMIALHIGSELSPEQIELHPVYVEKYPEEVIAIQEFIASRQKAN